MDICTDYPCILQDIAPFGAAAQKAKDENQEEVGVRGRKKEKEEREGEKGAWERRRIKEGGNKNKRNQWQAALAL